MANVVGHENDVVDVKKNFMSQPKGFYNVWIGSINSNFAFYVFYGILGVFFKDILGYTEARASLVFGSFMALNWGFTPVGGFLSDSILGPRRCMVIGQGMTTLGYIVCSIGAFYGDNSVVMSGFALILLGNSTIRVNYNKMLGFMYEDKPKLADSGYTLFYASVNVGSFLAFIVGSFMRGGEGSASIYGYIFSVSSIFSGIAFLIYCFSGGRWRYLLTNREKSLSVKVMAIVAVGFVAVWVLLVFMLQNRNISNIIFACIAISAFIAYFIILSKESSAYQKKMLLAFGLMIEAVFFYVLYAQMGTSMNFFAINNVQEASIFGIYIDPIVYQAFNPLWIIVATPFLAIYFNKKSEETHQFMAPKRFAIAMFISAAAFFTLGITKYFANDAGMYNVFWLALANVFQSVAELMIGALGLSMVIKFTPSRISGLVFGLWYLTLAIANIIGGYISSLTGIDNDFIQQKMVETSLSFSQITMNLYSKFFIELSIAIFVVAVLMAIAAPFLTKLGLSSEKKE